MRKMGYDLIGQDVKITRGVFTGRTGTIQSFEHGTYTVSGVTAIPIGFYRNEFIVPKKEKD